MILPVYKNEKRSIIKLNRYQKQIKKIYDKVNLNHDMQEYIENENLLRIQNIRDRFYVKNLKIVKNSINLFLNW